MSNNIIKQPKISRVDFINSNIGWGGPSQGIFCLISLLTYKVKKEEDRQELFGLSQAVLAGNMYSDKELLKQPPYIFQVSGSISKQKIYRTYLPDRIKNNKTIDDSDNVPFNNFKINIKNEKAKVITSFEDVKASFAKNRFSAKVFFDINNHDIELEFPINHINIKPEMGGWQVETGPILFPNLIKNEEFPDHVPSFIHFNSFDKLDIFYDYPLGLRAFDLDNKGVVAGLPCKIQLLSN